MNAYRSNSPPKHTLLLAVDPSLTASGWALYSLRSARPVAWGIVSPPSSEVALAHRLDKLQRMVGELLRTLGLGDGDFLVCEGPAPLVKNPMSALKVEHVRGIFEVVARTHGVCVPGRLNPRTVQTELLGMRGQQIARKDVKLWARATVERLFPNELREIPVLGANSGKVPQDVIDAVLIGVVALARIDLGRRAGVDPAEVFQLRKSSRRIMSGRRRAFNG